MLTYFRKPNSAALAFMVAGAFWFVLGTIYGLFSAIHFVDPEFFSNISYLTVSRVRSTHTNTVIFGFATTTLIGAGLYYTPALLRTRLWSEPLAWVSFFFWNLTIASGPITFGSGHSQGREYTEYLWFFDISFMLAVLIMVVNLVMTVIDRREKTIYVSVWYFVAMFLWTAGSYPIGNVIWLPPDGALAGMLDSIYLWFWGHVLPGLVLTPVAVGAAYFVIPRVVRQPLNSHTLSLIGFWSLVFFYTHIGGHHILQTPIPAWLKVMSVASSMSMVVPVFVALANLWLTARGFGGRLLADPAGRWVITGTIWYLITCIQGPVQSLPVVQRVTHLTNWTVGHTHIAVLGFAGFIAIGSLWHILPLITHRLNWSNRLINLQFGLVLFGLTGFFVVLTIAGLIQGESWNNGETEYRTLEMMWPYMTLRLAAGVSIVTGAIIGFYNLIMSIRKGTPFSPLPLEREAPQ
jgi:cbb3-type cytochrome c oxidase subunit I